MGDWRGALRAYLCAGAVLMADHAVAVSFTVSPAGRDDGPGTSAQPFATPARARDALREIRRANGGRLPAPATIWLRGGLYELETPLELTEDDGGTPECPVTYAAVPGETPILSGGRVIGAWQPEPNGRTWRASLPAATGGTWVVNQLFLRQSGQSWFERRYRPTRGLQVIAGLSDAPHRNPAGRIDHRNPQQEVLFRPGDLRDWEDVADIELVFLHDWSSGRMRIASLDLGRNLVRFAEFPHYRIGHWYPGSRNPYLIENLGEAFGEPGVWHLDRTAGVLRYTPKAGEDMATATVVVPRLECLATLHGRRREDACVEHIRFQGITFAHTAWTKAPHLYAEAFGRQCRQGFVDMPAAVTLSAARNCRFERCTFANLGAYAVDLGEGCHDNAIVGNLMVDLGTGGVKVGTVDRAAAPPVVPTGNRIANNLISDAGVEHYSGHGIWGGICARTSIEHNVVTRTLYSSIAVGWSHSREETACRDNLIAFNHVHDVMLLLDHGGAIYTLGNQPGTVIRGNLVHGTHHTRLHGPIKRPDWSGGGLAFDDGSSSFVVEGNILYDIAAPADLALTQGRSAEMTVRDNVCGIRPGEPGFPADAAARAGLEPAYRDLLQIPFRAEPPPILAMELPRDLQPAAIVDTFDRLAVGSQTNGGTCRVEDREPGKGTDAIVVTDETAAEGPHSLKIVDAPGLSRPWLPYLSYSPRFDAGTANASFFLRLEAGAEVEVVWRGRHPEKEFSVGPQLTLRHGRVFIRDAAVMDLPTGVWVRFEMRAALGDPDPGIGQAGLAAHGTWSLTVTLPDAAPMAFSGLPVADPACRDFGTLMFISLATERAVFYIDSVQIAVE